MAIDLLHFMFNLIIAGFILRFTQMKLLARNSELGKAIAFVY